MEKATGYSLWLRPFGNIAFSLRQRIQKLSKRYDTPDFEPHVTLLGGLNAGEQELIQWTDMLGHSIAPFDIKLTRLATGNSFYQSLFIEIEKTDELMNARRRAEDLFDVKSTSTFKPHLSLLYSDFSVPEKKRLLNTMSQEIDLQFKATNVLLIKSEGTPDQWDKVHAVNFAESAPQI